MKFFSLRLALSMGLLLAAAGAAYACTNLLVTKGASADGSTLVTYLADSHTLYGELVCKPSADHPAGSMREVVDWDSGKPLGRIPEVAHTYAVVGNMNEHQLVIGETTYGGRSELEKQTGAIMDYGSLIYISLERSRTAREAIKLMGELMAQYGYASEGESFSIADGKEVWIMEIIGKGEGEKGAVWVAQRIPDGYVCAHANQARITTFPLNDPENCLYSPDVVAFAKKKGWVKADLADKDFSFSDTYAPLDFGAARGCESRVWSIFRRVASGMDGYIDYVRGDNLAHRMPLWVKPEHKITIHEAMELMRDHFEGTEFDMTKDMGAGPYACPYRWRPLTYKVDGKTYTNERAISTQQTGFSFVAQSRDWLPDPVGGVFWFGVDDSYSSVYMPMYCGILHAPESMAVGNGSMMEMSETSAFWVFNQVANFAYTRYRDIIPEVRALQADLEKRFLIYQPVVDQAALELHKKDPGLAREFLTDYSCSQGDGTVKRWKGFYHYLFTKFMDGNIKTPVPGQMNPKVSQPGYGDDWYRKVVQDAGTRLEVKGEAAH